MQTDRHTNKQKKKITRGAEKEEEREGNTAGRPYHKAHYFFFFLDGSKSKTMEIQLTLSLHTQSKCRMKRIDLIPDHNRKQKSASTLSVSKLPSTGSTFKKYGESKKSLHFEMDSSRVPPHIFV